MQHGAAGPTGSANGPCSSWGGAEPPGRRVEADRESRGRHSAHTLRAPDAHGWRPPAECPTKPHNNNKQNQNRHVRIQVPSNADPGGGAEPLAAETLDGERTRSVPQAGSPVTRSPRPAVQPPSQAGPLPRVGPLRLPLPTHSGPQPRPPRRPALGRISAPTAPLKGARVDPHAQRPPHQHRQVPGDGRPRCPLLRPGARAWPRPLGKDPARRA